jgi:hypothetical protein
MGCPVFKIEDENENDDENDLKRASKPTCHYHSNHHSIHLDLLLLYHFQRTRLEYLPFTDIPIWWNETRKSTYESRD